MGTAACNVLAAKGYSVVRIARRAQTGVGIGIGDIEEFSDWGSLVNGVDVVLHLVGRAHVLKETEPNPLALFRRVNLDATMRLAHAAQRYGVERFVFLSTIGVNGVATTQTPFCELDDPNPSEAYAVSKLEAEESLRSLSRDTGFEVTIVRPPLIYGPGVKGNFLRLLSLVGSGIPLPLRSVNNRRSFLGLDNLCELLSICCAHEAAAGKLFLAADGEDLSTPRLLRILGRALGKEARLFTFPPRLVRWAATLAGRRQELDKLTSSLQVNSEFTRRTLGWRPITPVREGLERMAHWYLRETGARIEV